MGEPMPGWWDDDEDGDEQFIRMWVRARRDGAHHWYCDCPLFFRTGHCKHILSVRNIEDVEVVRGFL
jgi:hypothetical protein